MREKKKSQQSDGEKPKPHERKRNNGIGGDFEHTPSHCCSGMREGKEKRKKKKNGRKNLNLAQFVDWVAHRRPLLRLRCNAQIHSGTSVTQHGRKCVERVKGRGEDGHEK
jgi:hypothetical protein